MSKKCVTVGNVKVGGGAPVSVQSMCSVEAHDFEGICAQIRGLTEAGCQIVRLAVPDEEAVNVFARVRKHTQTPLVADIHFDYRLAIAAIEAGADKIRINPGNIGDRRKMREVVKAASERNIPIRVGVNSGSLERDILEKWGKVTSEALAESALRNLEIIEDMGYDNLVVSLKSSDVKMNYRAHRIVSERTEHPIHIGITEAGTLKRGKTKSAAGIGALLLSGIGDTMRVSLTADPVEEVRFAVEILEVLGMRVPAYNLVSCPTCGRTRINLEALAEEVEQGIAGLSGLRQGIKIAVMGCVVNGPGEARMADYGVAGGDGKGVIFKEGQILKTVSEGDLAEELLKVIVKNERAVR